MSNSQNLPDFRPRNITPSSTALAEDEDRRRRSATAARKLIARDKPGETMLGLIDNFRAVLIEAADRIGFWEEQAEFERGWLNMSRGRRATLARETTANVRGKCLGEGDRGELPAIIKSAVNELETWTVYARTRMAECRRNIAITNGVIRDLLAALALVYGEAYFPRRAPEYKTLLAALEVGLPDHLLPKTPLRTLVKNARRECARPATAFRWPCAAAILSLLPRPAGTIEPEIH